MKLGLRPERLLSVGSIVADIRIDVPHLPPRGGDVLASTASISAGGGFNVLAAAARNRLPSVFGGRHGTGPYGARIRAELARENIATLFAPSSRGDSGFCVVMVEPDGERTFVTSPGVEAQIATHALDDLDIRPTDAVFVSGYDLGYPLLGGEIARWIGLWTVDALLVVDPGPLVAEIPTDIFDAALARARVLTLNRREAALFAGTDDVGRIAGTRLAASANRRTARRPRRAGGLPAVRRRPLRFARSRQRPFGPRTRFHRRRGRPHRRPDRGPGCGLRSYFRRDTSQRGGGHLGHPPRAGHGSHHNGVGRLHGEVVSAAAEL